MHKLFLVAQLCFVFVLGHLNAMNPPVKHLTHLIPKEILDPLENQDTFIQLIPSLAKKMATYSVGDIQGNNIICMLMLYASHKSDLIFSARLIAYIEEGFKDAVKDPDTLNNFLMCNQNNENCLIIALKMGFYNLIFNALALIKKNYITIHDDLMLKLYKIAKEIDTPQNITVRLSMLQPVTQKPRAFLAYRTDNTSDGILYVKCNDPSHRLWSRDDQGNLITCGFITYEPIVTAVLTGAYQRVPLYLIKNQSDQD